jgi:hypothetical protein
LANTGVTGRIAALEPRTPPDLAAIVDRAMAYDPAARYANARELADDCAGSRPVSSSALTVIHWVS